MSSRHGRPSHQSPAADEGCTEPQPAAPLLVRIAGLPAEVMQAFASDLCQRLEAERELEGDLATARGEMVDRLYEAIHGAPPDLRRSLLAVKRDCYNGRPLARHRKQSAWEELLRIDRPLAERILDLETRWDAARGELETAYQSQSERESRQLAGLVADRRFLRGVALASPVLAEQAERWRSRPEGLEERKEKKLTLSLLRYASRAALKLSPFSTFTPVALGTARNGVPENGLLLAQGPWPERSVLRLKQFVPRLWEQVLLRYPPFQAGLEVTLNSSLEEVQPGQFRLLRPGFRHLDEDSGRFRYEQDSLITLKLGGPLIGWLREELPRRRLRWGELLSALREAFGGGDEGEEGEDGTARAQLEQALEQLRTAGLLTLVPPWISNEPCLEARLLEHLRTLPPRQDLAPAIETLGRIVETESRWHQADDPAATLRSLGRLIEASWQQLSPLGSIPSSVQRPGVERQRVNVYEDVVIEAAEGGKPWRELAQLPSSTLEELAVSTGLLVRLSHLLSHRLDFAHAVGGWIERLRPDGGEIPFLDLFSTAQPLWQAYVKFDLAAGAPGLGKAPFNPLELPRVAELSRLRDKILTDLPRCVESTDGESRVDRATLEAVLEPVPEAYTPLVGACLALQPADEEGSLWVLNRLYEGTGRMGSRFTPLLRDEVRRRYADHLTARSALIHDGELVELFDLFSIHDNLNVHAVQTPRILELPGERIDLPAERRLGLRDLRLSADEATGLPRLRDGEGRRLLPLHLGAAVQEYMPVVVKFLAALGPGDLRALYPRTTFRWQDDLLIRERLTLDRLVLHRKRWKIPRERFPPGAEGTSEAEAFRAVHRWRMDLGLPERVFLIEKRAHELMEEIYKPQFLDLTSPLFVRLLRSILQGGEESLIVEEMLPEPPAYPRDSQGRSWALEILVDDVALRPQSPAAAARVRSSNRTSGPQGRSGTTAR